METIIDELKYQLGVMRATNAFPQIDAAIRDGYMLPGQRNAAVSMAVEYPAEFEKFIGVCKPAPGALTPLETELCHNLGVSAEKFLATKARRAK